MTGRIALIALAGLCLPAVLAMPVSPAAAQCRLCEKPTLIADPASEDAARVRLEIETSLDFDQLVVIGTRGSATLSPDGARFAEGGVAALSARAMLGEVVIRGEPGRPLAITLPSRIELHSPSGGRILLEAIESDLSAAPKLDAAGELRFRFGGRLVIDGDSEGDFRGDVPITAEYL